MTTLEWLVSMWSKPVARLPEQVLDVGGTSGPWWPIHAVQPQQQHYAACTASPVLLALACRKAAWATAVCSAGPLPPPRGPICGGSTFFSNCCKDVGVGTKQPKGAGSRGTCCSPDCLSVLTPVHLHPSVLLLLLCSTLPPSLKCRL